MNWGRFDEAAWWWEYGLDGFVGGAVTAATVGVTLWHTQRLSREAAERQREQIDEAAAREQAISCQSAVWGLVNGAPTHDDRAAFHEKRFMLIAVAHRRWPKFADKVLEDGEAFAQAVSAKPMDKARVVSLGGALVGAIGAWMREPNTFEEVTAPSVRGRLRRLRERWQGRDRQLGSSSPAQQPTPAPLPHSDQTPES